MSSKARFSQVLCWLNFISLLWLNIFQICGQQEEQNFLQNEKNLLPSYPNELEKYKEWINEFKGIFGTPVFLFNRKDDYICVTRTWTQSPGGPWLIFWCLQKEPIFFISKFKEPDGRVPPGYWLYKCQKDTKDSYFFTVCIILNDPRGGEGLLQTLRNKSTNPFPCLLNLDIRTYKIYNSKQGIEVKAIKGISGYYWKNFSRDSENWKTYTLIPTPSLEDILYFIKEDSRRVSYYQPPSCIKNRIITTKGKFVWECEEKRK